MAAGTTRPAAARPLARLPTVGNLDRRMCPTRALLAERWIGDAEFVHRSRAEGPRLMSTMTTLPRSDNPLRHRLPDYRALLEEGWQLQVADIVQLSFAFLAGEDGEPDDDGTRATELHVAARRIAAARQQLEETEAALARVDDGSYGLCASCSEPIAPERLETLPAARYCVGCPSRSHGNGRP
jgi:RNA polymerase-binding transcription factor